MLKILIADDHALVRDGLKSILREMAIPSIVSEATNGLEAVELGCAEEWDVIVLDITMPGQSGLEALKILKQARATVPIVMLSGHAGDHYVKRSLRDGASGYVSKESASGELIAAIQAVMAGEIYLSKNLTYRPVVRT